MTTTAPSYRSPRRSFSTSVVRAIVTGYALLKELDSPDTLMQLAKEASEAIRDENVVEILPADRHSEGLTAAMILMQPDSFSRLRQTGSALAGKRVYVIEAAAATGSDVGHTVEALRQGGVAWVGVVVAYALCGWQDENPRVKKEPLVRRFGDPDELIVLHHVSSSEQGPGS